MATRFRQPHGTVSIRDVGEWAEDVERERGVTVVLKMTLLNHQRGRVGWFLEAEACRGGPLMAGPVLTKAQAIYPCNDACSLEGKWLALLVKLDRELEVEGDVF